MARPSSLSAPSQELVLTALRKHKTPMTAYSLLEKLKKMGIKSPPIIYRALEGLMQTGAVHKIKALNAFIACNCAASHQHALSVLTVCHSCESVEELHDHLVIDHLEKLRKHGVPIQDHAVIELPITCVSCTA
ncbi:MAG: transcriptional repressor [Rickettsiales bacterium]|nr:transcriptional repressor [Rickettsiales bacterium]